MSEIRYKDLVIRILPSGVSDSVEIAEDGRWYKHKRVSEDTPITSAPSWSVDDVLTNTVRISKQIDAALLDGVFADNENTKLYINGEKIKYKADTLANDEECYRLNSLGPFKLRIKKSRLSTVDAAGVAKFLNENIVALNYQIANDTTPPAVGDVLMAEPGGTVILEPFVKAVGVYGANMAIASGVPPINALEAVTDIALGTCTVAGDKLSFTSPSLAAGDKSEYSYNYDSALSTIPTIVLTLPDGRTVEATAPVVSLPVDCPKGKLGIVTKGNTRTNLIKSSNMNVDTNADGVVDDFSSGNTIGATFALNDSAQKISINNCTTNYNLAFIRQGSNSDSVKIPCAVNEIISCRVDCKFIKKTGSPAAKMVLVFRDSVDAGIGVHEAIISTTNDGYTELKIENKIAPPNTVHVSITCVLITSVTASTTPESADVWFKNAMLEKAASIGNYISTGTKSALSLRAKSIGKNSFNKLAITGVSLYATVTQNDTGVTINVSSALRYREVIWGNIKLLPNTTYKLTYTVSKTSVSGGGYGIRDNATKVNIVSNTTLSGDVSVTFTTPAHGVIEISLFATGSTSETSIATFTNIALNADGVYEPYKYTEMYTPSDTVLRSVGNAKDEISVGVDGQRYKTIRISVSVLQDSNIVQSMATGYGNVDYLRIPKPEAMGKTSSDIYVLDGYEFLPTMSNDWANINNIGKTDNWDDNTIAICFPKGTTLESAKAQVIGKTLTYQLAAPITTQLGEDPAIHEPATDLVLDYPADLEESVARKMNQVPDYYHYSDIFTQIQTAITTEGGVIHAAAADLQGQLFIITATWGLKYWEEALGISTVLSDPFEIRRSRVLSKWRGVGNFSAALIKSICEAFTNGEVEVSSNPENTITIKFNGALGVPPNVDDLKAQIDNIVHAHLGVEYQYKYLTIAQVATKTIAEIDATQLSNFAPFL